MSPPVPDYEVERQVRGRFYSVVFRYVTEPNYQVASVISHSNVMYDTVDEIFFVVFFVRLVVVRLIIKHIWDSRRFGLGCSAVIDRRRWRYSFKVDTMNIGRARSADD